MPTIRERITKLYFSLAGTPTPVSDSDPLPVTQAGSATAAKQLADNHQVTVSNPITGFATASNQLPDGHDVAAIDSGEREYSPGLTPALVTASGETIVYTAPTGVGFRIRKFYAVPIVRGVEDAPVITLKILDSAGSLYTTFYIAAAVCERKPVTGPAGGKIVVSLDIAARVGATFDIEEL
jgi:hypothetical protein